MIFEVAWKIYNHSESKNKYFNKMVLNNIEIKKNNIKIVII